MKAETGSEFDRDAAYQKARELVIAGMEPEEALVNAGIKPKHRLWLPKRSPTRDTKELREFATKLLKKLVPQDFGNVPIYIGMQSELPEIYQGISSCAGFTSSHLDEMLKPHLGSAYEGRGVAMFLADQAVTRQVDKFGGGGVVDTNVYFRAMLTTVVHEAAHILERDELIGPEVADSQVEAVATETATDLDSQQRKKITNRVPYRQHEWDFIRNCIHLKYRAECGGVALHMERSAAGERYGLSSFEDYRNALGDEPSRMFDASFREIRDTEMPDQFWELWRKDMKAFSDRVKANVRREIEEAQRAKQLQPTNQ